MGLCRFSRLVVLLTVATACGSSGTLPRVRKAGQAGSRGSRPGLPRDSVRVLERHPEGFVALPGYVWLDTSDGVRRWPSARRRRSD